MSLLDSILSNTVGQVFSAVSGNVDPWTKANLDEGLRADISQAKSGSSPDDIKIAQDQASQGLTDYLTSIDADPSQAGLRLPGLGVFGGSGGTGGDGGCAESAAAGTSCGSGLSGLKKVIVDPFKNLVTIAIIGGAVIAGVVAFGYLAKYLRKVGVK